MKALTIREAQGQLAELIAEAHRGTVIVLTDGEREVRMETHNPLDLDTDNTEIETELLKGARGPFTRYSPGEMRSTGERLIKAKQQPTG